MLYSCGRTIGHLTVEDFAVTGVPLLSVCVSSELERWTGRPKADGLALLRMMTV